MANRVLPVTVRVACAQLIARELAAAETALEDVTGAIAAAGALGADVVVLPECSYPGYVLLGKNPYTGRVIPPPREAMRRISEAARRARINAAVGIANVGPDGVLRNEAVLFDRMGSVVGTYAKAHLWNFDRRWFAGGRDYPVFETDLGRVGMMICADGRVPEIARTLAHRGAWLVLDPTAWVGVGPSYGEMPNPQVEFSLRVRALENGIWIAAADKCGSEAGSVHYVGKSMVVGPDGTVMASAPADVTALIIADIRRRRTRPFVAALSAVERTVLRAHPKRRPQTTPAAVHRVPIRIGVFQGTARSRREIRSTASRSLTAQGAQGIIETASGTAAIKAAVRSIRGLRSVMLEGARMLAPEPARAAALAGADLLVWASPPKGAPVAAFARTRAMENRVFVLVCTRSDQEPPACLIGPEGSINASALTGIASGFIATVDPHASRDKNVVCGTNAFADRTPESYELFV